jgi:hypothetical protein
MLRIFESELKPHKMKKYFKTQIENGNAEMFLQYVGMFAILAMSFILQHKIS